MPLKKPYWHRIILICIVISLCNTAEAKDSTHFKNRKQLLIGSNLIGYSSLMVGLNELWYKDYPTSKFHFFNDNQQWLQMDKIGHAFSCYYEGLAGIRMMKWAGFNHKQSTIIGGSYGLFVQTGIEVLDGFSEAWGASSGDMIANISGTALVVIQGLYWDEQKLLLKYSYSPTKYPDFRPELLGSSLSEQILKDYNGQTYWLSCNIHSIFPEKKFPNWLNIAFGYGAQGMVGGNDNIFERENAIYDYSFLSRNRQFYISPDIDLSKLKIDNKLLKSFIIVINCIKFPMPALEYHTNRGFVGHWMMF